MIVMIVSPVSILSRAAAIEGNHATSKSESEVYLSRLEVTRSVTSSFDLALASVVDAELWAQAKNFPALCSGTKASAAGYKVIEPVPTENVIR